MSSDTDKAIVAHGLEKSYGDTPVLWGLELSVGWGELVALLGANGVGKSTLLRILSTQVRADGGSARVAGLDVRRRAAEVRRQVGVVAHSNFLYDDLTCAENLVYYARLFGLNGPHQRALDCLATVGLSHRSHHRTRSLSHGQQKRVAIARAVLHQPAVLLMDEPESGLDAESLLTLREVLTQWTAQGGSVLMTTHNTHIAHDWADRVGTLAQGKVHYPGGDPSATPAQPRELAAVSPASQR